MVVQKDVFWKAAVLAVIIFGLGVLLGYVVEEWRFSRLEQDTRILESEWEDVRLQSEYYKLFDPTKENCAAAIDKNIEFADRVYWQSRQYADYKKATKIAPKLAFLEEKRHVLLRLQFWLNSVYLKDKCDADYINIVYFYASRPTPEQEGKQDVQAGVLHELKMRYSADVMLIALPTDFDVSLIDIMLEQYTIDSIPAVLIDERFELEGVSSVEDIEEYIAKI